MHVLMTGGTGFIGRELCRALLAQGHEVTVYSRKPYRVSQRCGPGVLGIPDLLKQHLPKPVDAAISLAGEPIASRPWTRKRKQLLRSSRIETTEKLLQLCAELLPHPECLISASAVGFYGDQGDREVSESTPPQQEFSHELCREWEQAALQAEQLGMRVCLVRTGLVLGRNGGFLKKLLLPFKLGLGGRLGSGQQWMPWIHMADLVDVYLYLLHHRECRGAYNATAPNPVTNAHFTQALGSVLHRPTLLPLPAFLLRLGLGEMSRLLLTGQKALPDRLMRETSFRFQQTDLTEALSDVLG